MIIIILYITHMTINKMSDTQAHIFLYSVIERMRGEVSNLLMPVMYHVAIKRGQLNEIF